LTRTDAASKPGFNLVANPYPSYLDWKMVSAANTGLLTTAWFRTKNNSGGYIFATVNVATPSSPVIVAVDPNTTITTLIPPMQAYWVRVSATGSTTYSVNNLMRAHADNIGNKFKAPVQNTQPLLRLRVSNGNNADETVVMFNTNATNGMDLFDSPKMSNNIASVPEIYTQIGSEKLVINGMHEMPIDTEIPLGFSTLVSNDFSISATEINNFDSNTSIILKDNMLNTEQQLTSGKAYKFSSDITSSTNRFSLIFRTSAISTDVNAGKNDERILVSKNTSNQIVINLNGELTGENTASVYNAVGQKLISINLSNNQTVINNPLSAGVYLVTVKSAGKNITGKIILN